ncbi:hypothetical protein QQ045_021897 [Rhodiola kirilowii]
MANHFPEPGRNNVRALCSSFCNATVNDSGFCPALCLPECPATCQYVLIPPTATPNHSKIYTLDPFFIATFASLAIGFLAICSYAVYLKYYSTRRRPGSRSRQEVELSGQVHCESINLGAVTVQKYRKGEALFREMECAVCLNEFQDGEALRILPNCKHAFHMCCVDVWLGSNISCPMCRASIVSCIAMEPASEHHIIDPV